MKLYTAYISPNGKRIHICALELGLDLPLHRLDFRKGENQAPDYLALNPMGKVPTLIDDEGRALWESPAILCHLAQRAAATGNAALWPASAREQTDLLRWLFFTAQHIDSYFTTLVVERFVKPQRLGTPGDEHLAAAAERDVARYLKVLEGQLATGTGAGRSYVVGDGERFSLADIALGCTLELAAMVRVELREYPRIRAWLGRLQSRPAWRQAAAAAAPPAG